jgi:hypothetical protein
MTADEPEILPSMEEAMNDLRTKPIVSAWPTVAVLLGLSRGGVFEAAHRGDFETLRFGKLIKVPTAPLRRKLGIEA